MGANAETRSLTEAEKLSLARVALHEFHAQCFWFWRADIEIGPQDIPEIVRGLRQDGGRRGFLLAAQLCR